MFASAGFIRQTGFVLFLVIAGTVLSGCGSTPKSSLSEGPRLYSFWPQFPAEPRIQFLTSYRYSSDIDPSRSGFEELVYGRDVQVLPIQKPYGVEMFDGRVYVCDIRNAGVIILDLKNQQTRVMHTSGVGGLAQPTDIAIAPDGMKYVADIRRGVIFVFDVSDRHVASFGFAGLRPAGVAVHEDKLYVSDFETLSVVVLDRQTGEQIGRIGEMGGEDGQFVRPLGVEVDADGNIYVMDVIKCRLQKFSPSGKLLMATGRISDTAGAFVRPKHLALDSEGIIYVVDAAFDNVQMFNDVGQVLMFFGSGGSHDGAMNLPAGICINERDVDIFRDYIHPSFEAEHLVIVTNQFGPRKVSVYAMGQLREGVSVQDVASVASSLRSGVTEETDTNPLPTPVSTTDNENQEQAEPVSDHVPPE